ncbi:tripartite tricarboxylate transporter permease [Ensifer adhaerens]|uniref:tripartite tricarboxylate transporter permease n=1 Tax=Ensifer TaxID=106591 RepID=UPI000713A09F|nr:MULTISPECIES: tripartite tricarboxylate transporter permease [unclassified Ensifer]KQX45183.1 tripartite tricarboxylate transporter TctA [Ensifer sp. Root1298]KQX76962.1 tripartite tricarboxylate transporter TctA [Ensifer sp. Root1312]KRC26294.1 tripartite tricarboxylate transporter TctA [Ensifer sp. Root74]KRD60284.1 tripartite tricarboxylate transporter TctA [Ensifer sp. Root954]MBD9524777.1 tripartite tricarboxylate transporter permease [Ensifer sp. ENS02]
MDTLAALFHGFAVAATPYNLFWSLVGVTLGTAIGVLPGIGPALTVALLLPVTYGMEPTSAFIMFAGIYYGAMYGGSTTSILLNTPGESASIVTALDGHAMARKGRGAQALATAAIGSFVAGTIATVALTFVAPLMVKMALLFGPTEYFALMVLALTTVTAVLGDSLSRGLASLLFGLALGLVGIDLQTGQARFTLGISELLDGIDVVVVAVGLFAVGETLFTVARHCFETEELYQLEGSKWMSREDWRRSWKPWLRGTALGFPIGALPAGGSEIPTFLSYLTEKRLSKNPEEFGHGAIEAVAGPEAANNASAAGVLAPLLALGLPTSATAAIMLAAFQQYGIQPGPLLFDNNPELVWGLIASLYIGNVMLLLLNLPLAGVWVKLLAIPRPWLYSGILLFATMGAYTLNNNIVDVALLWIIGVIGFGMRVLNVPVAPCIVGLILGPLAEQQFRRALTISQGDASVFFTHPISLALIVIAVTLVLVPTLLRWRAARQAGEAANQA